MGHFKVYPGIHPRKITRTRSGNSQVSNLVFTNMNLTFGMNIVMAGIVMVTFDNNGHSYVRVCWWRNNWSCLQIFIKRLYACWTGKLFRVLTLLTVTLKKYPVNPIQATCLYVRHINTPHSTLLRYWSSKSRIHESMIHQSVWVISQDVVVFLTTIYATVLTVSIRRAHANVCFLAVFICVPVIRSVYFLYRCVVYVLRLNTVN